MRVVPSGSMMTALPAMSYSPNRLLQPVVPVRVPSVPKTSVSTDPTTGGTSVPLAPAMPVGIHPPAMADVGAASRVTSRLPASLRSLKPYSVTVHERAASSAVR